MICQEVNAEIRDIFLYIYIEGFNNSTAQQQIRIQCEIVLQQSIRVLLQLRSSVVEKSGRDDLNLKHIFSA
jgi:hypothetical protein